MPFARPLHEYMIWIGKFWESPRQNKTCVGTVDDLPQGLNQADEYKGVLGPGLWRFVAASLTFPLRVARICHRWDPSDVWSWGAVHVPVCDSFSFCALPCREIQNHNQPFGGTCSLVWHLGHAMARGMQLWPKCHHPTGMQTGTVGLGQPKLLSVLQCSCKHEKCLTERPGLSTKVWGVSAPYGQQWPGLLQNPRLSVCLGLVSRGCWPPSPQTQWMCSPFQAGCALVTGFAASECRFPLPYLVLGKKRFVLSILASARNVKF